MHKSLILACLLLAACNDDKPAAPDLGSSGVDGFSTQSFDLGCASSSAQAKLIPVNLVVLLDASGSMGDGINGDPTLKWNPVTSALEAFFADPQSLGMSASLAFFPEMTNPTDQCDTAWYYPPTSPATVPMKPLPDTTAFTQAIAAIKPGGSTPTLPALEGAIMYATETAMMSTDSRSAIVLVTDGDPDTCDSSVSDVSFQVMKAAQGMPPVPTYVIGVGPDATSLQQIASAGGTGMPTFVSVGNAMQTATDFQSALEAIRGLVLTCDFPVPQPPAGMSLDFHSVNVVFTPSQGGPSELLYDKSCASGVGWRYDDPQNPTKVILCDQTCSTVKQDHGGKIDVVFGCATAGDLIQ